MKSSTPIPLKQPRNKCSVEPTPLCWTLLFLLSEKFILLSINLVLAGKQICVLRPDPAVLVHELVPEDHDEV